MFAVMTRLSYVGRLNLPPLWWELVQQVKSMRKKLANLSGAVLSDWERPGEVFNKKQQIGYCWNKKSLTAAQCDLLKWGNSESMAISEQIWVNGNGTAIGCTIDNEQPRVCKTCCVVCSPSCLFLKQSRLSCSLCTIPCSVDCRCCMHIGLDPLWG